MQSPVSTRATGSPPQPEGASSPLHELLPLVYEELRRIAHHELRSERPDHTLSTTALVHETYLKLIDQNRLAPGERARFFAAAVTAMRRVLIGYARQRRALKRGGGDVPLSLDESAIAADESSEALLALDDALTRLGTLSPRLARVVECRYFGGLTEEETAEVLLVTPRTVRRDWVKAKGWLYQELSDDASGRLATP
jgi:RNA polymerase sigma factor (TIGR02999 family)